MFKRRIIILVVVFAVALGFLVWKWNDIPGISLEASAGPVSTQRMTLDLKGAWDIYPSLRQAWVTESERLSPQKQEHPLTLTAGQPIQLPSTQKFHVAAKNFRMPADWSARNVLLQIQGVKGQGAIYLNGMESTDRLGEFADDGGTEEFLLPANAIHYGEDNLLLIESSAPPLQKNTLFGLNWPSMGQITGSLQLVGTMETSLSPPQVTVRWDKDNALVSVQTRIIHHGFLEHGPWSLQGVLSDGSSEVATASAQVNMEESSAQVVNLTFTVPQAHRWSAADPYTYQLYLNVINPKGDKDDLAMPLGLTSIAFQQEKFIFNGQILDLKGTTLSIDQEAQLRHAGKVKEWLMGQKNKGYNLIYFIGAFPDEIWLSAADQIGIGIWAELPVGMVPANRLPNSSVWSDFIREEGVHPSLWAYTAGTGLEVDPRIQNSTFWKDVQAQAQPLPVFMARVSGTPWLDQSKTFQLTPQGFQGPWGKVVFNLEDQGKAAPIWPQESWIAGVWAAGVLIIVLANVGTVNWRYKELKERRPKRALRKAWFWQGLALLTREGTLAGILTSLFFHVQVPWAQWLPDQWPLWSVLKQQSPALLWLILALLFVLVRLLRIGVAAPYMTDAPASLGLAFWLERRYRWIWIPAVLWAAQPWGIPSYIPLVVYTGLSLLFLPIRLRDVHKAGGKYRPFLLVPGIFILASLFWVLWGWADFYYLWHLLFALKII